MKISVITVCRNANKFIDQCLKSVAGQTYPQIEHIVIDGASDDGTVDTIRKYPYVSALVSEPDHGIYHAMNKGIARATGDFLLFLNADDYFVDAKVIEDVVALIQQRPEGDVYYGSLHVRQLDGSSGVYTPDGPEKATEIMVCGCLPHQSTLARRRVFEHTNGFDESYAYHADYDWFLKVIGDPEIKMLRLDRVISSFRQGGTSFDLAKSQLEAFHIQNKAPVYSTSEWDKRRIEILQKHWLQERIAAITLRNSSGAFRLGQRLKAAVTRFSGWWPSL